MHMLITSLIRLYKEMICTGSYPKYFKILKIIPIHEGGDIDDLTNHRPIDLDPICRKLLDVILKKQRVNLL